MLYLILTLLFGYDCTVSSSALYRIEESFKHIQSCKCITGDVLTKFKSRAYSDLSIIAECDSLDDRVDSVRREIKRY